MLFFLERLKSISHLRMILRLETAGSQMGHFGVSVGAHEGREFKVNVDLVLAEM